MKRNLIVLILVTIVFFNYNEAFAADALYRLMHNDHDALVLGEVTEVLENGIKINVVHQIISSQDLNVSSQKKQIPLKGTVTIKGIKEYAFFRGINTTESSPQKGDYLLVSIVKKGVSYTNQWGIYKVDSKDYSSLNVLYPKEAFKGNKMDASAIKTFVNSNGTINDFSFDHNTGKVYSNGKVVYEEKAGNNENIANEDIATSHSHKNGKVVYEKKAGNNENIANEDIATSHSHKNIFLYVLIGIILTGMIIGAYVIRKRN